MSETEDTTADREEELEKAMLTAARSVVTVSYTHLRAHETLR